MAAGPPLPSDDGHLRGLAAALGLSYLLPLGSGSSASVFKARSQAGAVAVKCLALPLEAVARARTERRARRERDLARWAAARGFGPPILRHVTLPLAACLVMPCADADLQRFWQREARGEPLEVLRQLWHDAFALVTTEALCAARWMGADLKPANLLLYRARRGSWSVHLNDFDARFWRRAEAPETARVINAVVLLSNALCQLPLPPALPHFPEAAVTLLQRLLDADEALLDLLRAQLPWLRRGLLHYSGTTSLEAHLERLRARALLHGL